MGDATDDAGSGGDEIEAPASGSAEVRTVDEADAGAGAVLTVLPGDDGAPRAAASAGTLTTQGDLRGLAAATCVRPGVGQWLVGGSTEVGSSAQLVLQNPGLTAATVQVTVWGQGGPALVEGGGQQLVGPGEQVVTLLEASVPEQHRTVVRVEATGGLVSAYLQHNTLDGLVPVGVDHVVPGAAPARQVALAGVDSAGEAVDDPHAPQLRLLAPGDEGGAVRVHVYGPDGEVPLRGLEEVRLEAGVVTDLSLGGLPAGRYAVAVDADVPVVAGARFDRRGERAPDLLEDEIQYDRAWIAAEARNEPDAPTAQDPVPLGQVALVDGTTSSLTLAAVPAAVATAGADGPDGTGGTGSTADPVEGSVRLLVHAYDADGAPLGEQGVDVPVGSTSTLDPATLATSDEESGAPAFVTVDVVGADGAAAVPLWSVLASAGPPGGDGDDGGEGGDEADSTDEADDAAAQPSLVSVLVPAHDPPGARTVGVRASDTAGLG
nr:DUF5719 family protein [Cellulosimicrobium arenosum]